MFLHRGSVQVIAGLLIFWACISFGSSQDDQVKVFFSKARIQSQEDTLLTINLVVSGIFRENFTCNLTFTSMTAMEFQDFVPIDRSADFVVGRTMSSAVRIAMVKDGVWEGTENLRVTFDLPVGNTNIQKGSPDSLQISILDTNVVQVSFMDGTVSTREPDGPMTLALNSFGTYNREFQISIQCNEVDPPQAINGADYSFSRSRVTFNDFDREETVSSEFEIDILDDFISESTESFICFLLTPFGTTGIIAGEPNTLTVDIFDDDVIPNNPVKLRFMSSRMKILEGSQSEIRILAIGAITENFTVNLKFTSENIDDFIIAENPFGLNVEVQFAVGETRSSPATLITFDDSIWEGVEELSVTFDLPPNMTNIQKGVPATLTVAIEDDDEIIISFVGNDTIHISEDIGLYPFQLKASGFYARAFTVRVGCFEVDSDNTATESDDYNLRKERVEFMESNIGKRESTSTNAELEIIKDEISEGDETFICVILLPTGQQADGRVVGEQDIISIIIKGDDDLEIGFEHSTYTGTEGEEVKVRLVATSEFAKAFQVKIFTTSLLISSPEKPYEAESADYVITPDTGRVRFDPLLGRASSELLIDLKTDCLVEGTEYFDLSIYSISDNETSITVADKNRTRVVITDINAVYVRPEFSMNHFDEDEFVSVRYEALYETSGTYMPVNSECYCTFGFNLEVRSEDITAKANMDYIEIINERVHFDAGERYSSNLNVTLIDDDIAEPTESLKLNYNINVTRSEEDAGSVLKLINSSEVIISDNDVEAIPCTLTDGSMVDDGTRFESGEPCMQDCTCKRGVVVCPEITCPTCDENAKVLPAPDGECCDVCACPYKGRDFMPGTTFAFGDGCNTCNCLIDGTHSCTSDDCELMPECSHDLCVNLTDEEQINTYCYIDANVSLGSIQYVHPSRGCFPVTTCASCYYNKQEKAIPRRCTTTEFKCRVQAFNRQRCLNRLGSCITKRSRYANVPDKRKIPDRFRCFLNKKRGTSSKQ